MALSKAAWRLRAAAGATLIACGCGLLGADDGALHVTRDPRTGFVDGPGIEVCLGGTRVVAPSRAHGGALSVCVSSGSVERPCSVDTECSTGERCVCGRCVTRPCRNATECEAHEACQGSRCASICTSDADCSPSETCNTGGCARRCSAHADCAFGERCSALDGTCIVKLCSETVSCGGDDACVEQERIADLREPHVTSWAGADIAYVELREQTTAGASCAIHRARVLAPRRWEIDPVEPVLAPSDGDGSCVGAPSVVAVDGRMSLYAARGDGSGLVRAVSTDGVTFARMPALVWSARRDWEEGWVGSPGATTFGETTALFYVAARGAAIGVLRVDEATGVVTAVSTLPALTPPDLEQPPFWRHVERVAGPSPVVREGALLLYFAARGAEGSDTEIAGGGAYPADVNDSIGLAVSTDLTTWEPFPSGPILARRANLRAYLGELEPSVTFVDGASWLVYVGADASGEATTGLGLATSGP